MSRIVVALLVLAAGCATDPDPTDHTKIHRGNGDDPGAGGGGGAGGGSGSHDPSFTENQPGNLAILSPKRAAFITDTGEGQITVVGTGATKALTINGQSVTPNANGTFTTKVPATTGLNLIRAVDGKASIDTPVLYGQFSPSSSLIPQAVAFRINELGFDNADSSVVSLTLLAQRAIDDRDLLAALDGQTMTGSIPGGSWTFHVENTTYGVTDIHISPRAGGAHFTASVSNIEVDGHLHVEVFGVGPNDAVALTVDEADVSGDIDIGYDWASSSITAAVQNVNTTLQNFHFDSGNAGFPCCVDSIATNYLRPKVQSAAQDQVRDALEQNLSFALSQLSLPSTIDLNGAGFPATVYVDKSFDGVSFDDLGGEITAAVSFYHDFADTDPGATSPGWLTTSLGPGTMDTGPSFGVSLSLDALNEALYAAWGQNGLKRTIDNIDVVGSIDIDPKLPPVVLPNQSGGLTAAAGEIVVDAVLNGLPIEGAITIFDDLELTLDSTTHALVLTPTPAPIVSVTWLKADGLNDATRQIIENQLLVNLPSLLTPVELPLPTLPLGGIASSFAGSVGALSSSAQLGIDSVTNRASVYGDLAIIY